MELLERPYTRDEIRERLDENGMIHGLVAFTLPELIDSDWEAFLDLAGERLVGSPLLMGVAAEPAGVGDGAVLVRIAGDPSEVLEEE